MAKEIYFNEEAIEKIKKGVNLVGDAVRLTLGGRGHFAVLENFPGTHPTVTCDGVTVARNIIIKDRTEGLGVDMIRDIADKTNDFAGDGTTTTVVFGQEIFNRGVKAISMGEKPHLIRRGLEAASEFAIKH